jgi:uncharacterized membrane protein
MKRVLYTGRLAMTATVVAALVIASVPGASQVRADSGDSLTLEVCNESSWDAKVAVHYVPVGSDDWVDEGWVGVSVGECADVAETGNSYIYVYAETEDGSDRVWKGDRFQCVEYPGPFRNWSTSDSECDDGQDARGFEEFQFSDGATRIRYTLE